LVGLQDENLYLPIEKKRPEIAMIVSFTGLSVELEVVINLVNTLQSGRVPSVQRGHELPSRLSSLVHSLRT